MDVAKVLILKNQLINIVEKIQLSLGSSELDSSNFLQFIQEIKPEVKTINTKINDEKRNHSIFSGIDHLPLLAANQDTVKKEKILYAKRLDLMNQIAIDSGLLLNFVELLEYYFDSQQYPVIKNALRYLVDIILIELKNWTDENDSTEFIEKYDWSRLIDALMQFEQSLNLTSVNPLTVQSEININSIFDNLQTYRLRLNEQYEELIQSSLELQRQQEEELQRQQELELQRQQQELELQRQQELELQRQQQELELQRQQQELELQRQQELELQRQQQELELQRQQQELELKRQQELELKRQQELELKRQQELELKRQQELELKRQQQELELQRQQEAELKRQQQELELQRQQEAELKRQQEAELQRQQQELELQRQQEAELQRQQEKELQRQRELELKRQQQIRQLIIVLAGVILLGGLGLLIFNPFKSKQENPNRLTPETPQSRLETAENLALSASQIIKNPPHPLTVWKQSQTQLQDAIQLLEAMPKNSSDFQKINQQLQIYQKDYNSISQILNKEQKATNDLEYAKKIAMEASVMLQNPPESLSVWQEAEQKWKQSINLLESIPEDSFIYPESQDRLKIYRTNHEAVVKKTQQKNQ
ncbi:hypothetical protein NO976_00883 [Planktothrix agardhii]|jgi:hypothetical protein|uniref:hypothetical protein n=1 Tax=Planktothrix agardhii TaxID=1160 RepID=UPI0020A766FF|nr:hypothetical protein [Planktothrix agardhii]CAD5924011.1 hypothetical protein NO976_00883 [Planktothrix agardhii]